MYTEVYPLEIQQGFTQDGVCVLMLYEPIESKRIPVMIGQHEAEMILLEKEGAKSRRPMTHELISSLFDSFNLALTEVSIDRFEEGIFYATLYVNDGFITKKIDCRASDAIVLALREEVAIKMDNKVIEETGFQTDNESELEIEEEETSIETLEALLHEHEENEEYEKAAELAELIEKLKNNR
ncbi:MAG: bifunctional nuclease family protein [Bacteroidales bacterium]|nr:bifunctional nuclease family protein [Bacteroidales bacterium]